ncbi:MAG: membrane-associated protein [Parcubacteria group bacterium Athens0416_74]|nr:MAG: membrane-associated protein [Parcubacteria group bacterium Athens0416_74]
MVDIGDLKSPDRNRSCGFESHSRYMQKIRDLVSLIWLPLFGLMALGSFYVVWTLLDLPPTEQVVEIAKVYFDKYGLLTIFICAIIEGILLAGWYFPGSFVIVLGVFLAGDDYRQLVEVFAVTTAGLLLAYMFNYFVGKYGWYTLLSALGFREALEKAKEQLTYYGPRAVFLTFWHPNLAALTSTAAGILHMPFRTYITYTIAATVLWDTFWTIVGYSLGEAALTVIGPQFVVAFIVLWVAAILFQNWRKPKPTEAVQDASQV